MSHNIETTNDMVYVGQEPWHGLGIKVENINTLPECLNWEIETRRIHIEIPNTTSTVPAFMAVKDHVAITRNTDNRVFGIASDDYVPHQNKDLWNTFVDFCNEGSMEIETAGMIKGGEIIWVLAKLNYQKQIGEANDWTKLYALIGSGHNNKFATFTKPTSIRVVCNNTFDMAYGDGKVTHRQVHRKEFDVKRAKEFVSTAVLTFNHYSDNASILAASPLIDSKLSVAYSTELLDSDKLNKAIIMATNGKLDLKNTTKHEWVHKILSNDAKQNIFEEMLDEKRRPVKELLKAIKEEETINPNWWHQFNGVTRYIDHTHGRSVDTRLYNAWFGQGAALKSKGFDLALEYAEAI